MTQSPKINYLSRASDYYRAKHYNAPFIAINKENGYLLPLIIITAFILAGYNF